jgi:hypothetical protein
MNNIISSTPKKTIIILIHAFIVWALCGATIGIGRFITTMEVTLIIHAIGAPVFEKSYEMFKSVLGTWMLIFRINLELYPTKRIFKN